MGCFQVCSKLLILLQIRLSPAKFVVVSSILVGPLGLYPMCLFKGDVQRQLPSPKQIEAKCRDEYSIHGADGLNKLLDYGILQKMLVFCGCLVQVVIVHGFTTVSQWTLLKKMLQTTT